MKKLQRIMKKNNERGYWKDDDEKNERGVLL